MVDDRVRRRLAAILAALLGSLFLLRGDRDSAIVHLREALRLEPGLSSAQKLLKRALAH